MAQKKSVREIIQIKGHYYILATSSIPEGTHRVLKEGQTFVLFNPRGDIQPIRYGEQGLYYKDTRFLSRLELRLGDNLPLLLSSTVKENNALLTVDLANPDMDQNLEAYLPKDTIHIFRTAFLWKMSESD